MESNKKYGKNIGKGLNVKTGEFLYKTPLPIIITLAFALMIASGWLLAEYNSMTAVLVSGGFTFALFRSQILLNVGILMADRLKMMVMKTFANKKLNNDYTKLTERCINSKVSDINEITTGKITDTGRSLCGFKWDNISYIFNAIPVIIPFVALLIKEWSFKPITAIISILSMILSASILVINEKLFGWDKEAKRVKAELQSITVDNFVNLPTFKYIHEIAFPLKRLFNAQKKAFVYELNTMKVIAYGVSLMLMWIPAICNVYLCRESIEMVAYIILTDYVLQNAARQVTAIIENQIEMRSCEKVLSPLKGDDKVSHEVFEGTMDLSGTSFKYSEDIEETRYQKQGKHEIVFNIEDVVIESGKSYLLKGESGSGKSSFATWLAGGLHTISGYDKKYLTYYIWQETSLYNDTILNNIIPGETDNMEKIKLIDYFADRLEMRNMIDNELPEGWNTFAGERGYRLSSGQKQRINLIRALVNMIYHPEMIYILDEITSNLDDHTRELAIELIFETCQSTLIIVSHNPGFEGKVSQILYAEQDHSIHMIPSKEIKIA